jgi:hypothetical protein
VRPLAAPRLIRGRGRTEDWHMVQPPKGVAALWAVATSALTAFAGYASVAGFGLGPCGGSGGVPNEAPPARDAICTIIEGHKPSTVFGPGHSGPTYRPLLWMALPLVVVLVGAFVAAVRRKPGWAAAAAIAAAVLLVLPWVALAVSHTVAGS